MASSTDGTISRNVESGTAARLDKISETHQEHQNTAHEHQDNFDLVEVVEAAQKYCASSSEEPNTLRSVEEKAQVTQDPPGIKEGTNETAMRSWFNSLPNEMLLQIFEYHASNLDSKVAISLVCKRFRSLIMSARHLWSPYWLKPSQRPEAIMAIAEGQRFTNLKMLISRFDEGEAGSVLGSTRTILSLGLHLVELDIQIYLDNNWTKEFLSMGKISLPVLRELTFRYHPSNNRPVAHFYECFDVPSLTDLTTDVVPPVSLAGNLAGCTFVLSGTVLSAEFLRFLSCCHSLRILELQIQNVRYIPDIYAARLLEQITFGGVKTLYITLMTSYGMDEYRLAPLLAEKMRFPDLESFELESRSFKNNEEAYSSLLAGSRSLKSFCLTISYFNLGTVLEIVPHRFRELHIKHANVTLDWPRTADASRWCILKRIIFESCYGLSRSFLRSLQSFLRSAGHNSNSLSIEFKDCRYDSIRQGSFTIDTLESAFIDRTL